MRALALLLLLGACAAPARAVVHDDSVTLRAGGRDLRPAAPSPTERDRAWRALRIGSVGVAVVGGFFLAFSPFDAAHDSPFAGHSLAVGLGLAAIGGIGIGVSTWQLSLPAPPPTP